MNYQDSTEHRFIRMVRSTTSLIIIALAIGTVLAATLGGTVWLIASALHHASSA